MYSRFLLCLLIASAPARATSTRDLPNDEFHAAIDKKHVEFFQGQLKGVV